MNIKIFAILFALTVGLTFWIHPVNAGDEIGRHELDTPLLSLIDKDLIITAYDDPEVEGVTCHVSDVVKSGALSWW